MSSVVFISAGREISVLSLFIICLHYILKARTFVHHAVNSSGTAHFMAVCEGGNTYGDVNETVSVYVCVFCPVDARFSRQGTERLDYVSARQKAVLFRMATTPPRLFIKLTHTRWHSSKESRITNCFSDHFSHMFTCYRCKALDYQSLAASVCVCSRACIRRCLMKAFSSRLQDQVHGTWFSCCFDTPSPIALPMFDRFVPCWILFAAIRCSFSFLYFFFFFHLDSCRVSSFLVYLQSYSYKHRLPSVLLIYSNVNKLYND